MEAVPRRMDKGSGAVRKIFFFLDATNACKKKHQAFYFLVHLGNGFFVTGVCLFAVLSAERSVFCPSE
jgi:hypothetical protein